MMGKRPRSGNRQQTEATEAIHNDIDDHIDDHIDTRIDERGLQLKELNGSVTSLEDASQRLAFAASRPEDFFQPNEQVAKELTGVLRQLFAFARRSEAQRKPFGPLEELYVDGLDCESIWAELELRNAPLEKHARRTLARLLESEDISLAADIESEGDTRNDDGDESSDSDTSNDIPNSDNAEEEEEEEEQEQEQERRGRKEVGEREQGALKSSRGASGARGEWAKQSEDEDMFFDADDMEKFADEGTMEDNLDDGLLDEMYGGGKAANGESSSDDGDQQKGLDEDSDDNDWDEEQDADIGDGDFDMLEGGEDKVGGGIKHSDFFGNPSSSPKSKSKSKSSRHEKEDGLEEQDQDFRHDEDHDADSGSGEGDGSKADSEDGSEDDALTRHAAHSKRMKGKINEQERELMAEKPWALRGEVQSSDRPENSLLEATVDVDRATRVAPLPTPERAMTLLDMIKKRCLGANWDDVTPRNIPGPPVRKEMPELSQDKSKEGLGEVYEKEFLKQTMGVEEDDPQAPLKTELKQLFSKLCSKLDALCNFHYTPKAIIPEMKVQADVAAIAMEEVLPSSVADAEALAPEEIYAKKRGREGHFLEAEEMDQTDRKRARASKKAARRKARRQAETEQKLVSKLNPGLGNKYEKAKMLRDIESAKNVTNVTGDESAGREFSTSTKFFSQLEATVKAGVRSAGQDSAEGGKSGDSKGARAAQFRL